MTEMRLGSGLHQQAETSDHVLKLSDPVRLDVLKASGLMAGHPDKPHDRCVRMASRILGAPVSLVSYVDTERQHFKAHIGLEGKASEDQGTPLTHSFCQYVVSSGKPLMIADSRLDPVLSDNGAVHDLNVIAYLGVPIHAPGGEVLGSFCVIDGKPRDWTQDDLDALNDLVAMLETDLALRQTVSERDVVLQEMNHRVRNLFSLINGMVRMDRRTATSVDELAESIAKRLSALNAAHSMIVPVVEASDTKPDAEGAQIDGLLEKLLAPYSGAARLDLSGPDVWIGPKAAVYLALTVHELATNAAKYGALSVEGGHLCVQWQVKNERLEIDWTETGQCWEDVTQTKGSGFGSQLLSISVEAQLSGTIVTDVTPDTFSHHISLPMERLAR
ncbi:two-component sensor histidine kinase [Sagittula marina]|uniref:histidine kinase n=1 Tax=Sagittula marina TaxID=943940 RepID=A0A7W6DNB3_9RHOB|nr:GAF domain-containing protein [Sagittula marina]MBB3983892.1 two-component sensor histidine kinase [Sagittula marina]